MRSGAVIRLIATTVSDEKLVISEYLHTPNPHLFYQMYQLQLIEYHRFGLNPHTN